MRFTALVKDVCQSKCLWKSEALCLCADPKSTLAKMESAAKTLVVAGGGVIGLSVARAAARAGLQVLLLEKNVRVGMETSARNSEVLHGALCMLVLHLPARTECVLILKCHDFDTKCLHTVAGIYYTKDSWKARLCVQGRDIMYDFCREYNVPFRQCGKLIVASSETQSQQLQAIAKKAHGNGVTDLEWLSQDEAKEVEPHVQCHEVRITSYGCSFLYCYHCEDNLVTPDTLLNLDLDDGQVGTLLAVNWGHRLALAHAGSAGRRGGAWCGRRSLDYRGERSLQ